MHVVQVPSSVPATIALHTPKKSSSAEVFFNSVRNRQKRRRSNVSGCSSAPSDTRSPMGALSGSNHSGSPGISSSTSVSSSTSISSSTLVVPVLPALVMNSIVAAGHVGAARSDDSEAVAFFQRVGKFAQAASCLICIQCTNVVSTIW